MIILNTCKDVKVQYIDSEPHSLFSMVILNKSDDIDLRLFDNVLVDAQTATFLREFSFEWLWSDDGEQLYGIRVDADKDTCRTFLSASLASNREIFLNDE